MRGWDGMGLGWGMEHSVCVCVRSTSDGGSVVYCSVLWWEERQGGSEGGFLGGWGEGEQGEERSLTVDWGG